MKKPLIIFLLLFFLYIAPVHAEDAPLKNTISGGISAMWAGGFFGILPGLNLEYERFLHNDFAIAVGVGAELIIPYVDLYARWYPWAGMFFADLGFGMWRQGFESWISMPWISPGIGWKINIGKSNKWNLIAGITGRIIFYESRDFSDINVREERENAQTNFVETTAYSIDITAKASIKAGYSF